MRFLDPHYAYMNKIDRKLNINPKGFFGDFLCHFAFDLDFNRHMARSLLSSMI